MRRESERDSHGFRLRGREVTRLEAFSDARQKEARDESGDAGDVSRTPQRGVPTLLRTIF